MRYRVHHMTSYRYSEAFANCHNQVRLTPRNSSAQRCISSEIIVEPQPEVFDRHVDVFGNLVESFSLHIPSNFLDVQAISEVDIEKRPPVPTDISDSWEQVRDLLAGDTGQAELDPLQYIFDSPLVGRTAEAEEYAMQSFKPGTPLMLGAQDLMKRINVDFKFDPSATVVGTSVAEVFRKRRGVCQDFAHLMSACLRAIGLPARYVSGYIRTDPAPGRTKLVGADASHAWCSTWCPKAGWQDFDPTNNASPDDRHITLAWGRDYSDVSPICGVVLGGGGHRIEVSVDVAPVETSVS